MHSKPASAALIVAVGLLLVAPTPAIATEVGALDLDTASAPSDAGEAQPDLAPPSTPETPSLDAVPSPASDGSASENDRPIGADCRPHPPIRITEDEGQQGFVIEHPVTGEEIPRPGSGVVAGNGTSQDPYVIAGWCIRTVNATSNSTSLTTGITVRDTSAHFVLQDNLLEGWNRSIHVLDVAASTALLENNTVTDSQLQGVRIDGSADAAILGNDLMENPGTALAVNGSNEPTIRANRIASNAQGVTVEASAVPDVRNNTFADQKGPGLAVNASPDARLVDNRFHRNWIGLQATNATQTLVEANELDDNVFSVRLENTAETQVLENRIRDNHRALVAEHTQGTLIADNQVRANNVGLQLQDTESTLLTANVVEDNRRPVTARDAPELEIRDNAFVDNGHFFGGSVRVVQAPHLIVAHNAFHDNGEGLEIRRSPEVNVRNNTIRSTNSAAGLIVGGSPGAQILENDLPGNQGGVRIVHSPTVTVRDNTIEHVDRGVGLALRSSVEAHIVNNTIRDIFFDGLVVANSRDTLLEDNLLSGTRDGIELRTVPNVTLRRNVLEGEGLVVHGHTVNHFDHDVDASNTVNGEPIRYLFQEDGAIVEGVAGQVFVADSANVTVRNVTLNETEVGVHAAFTDNLTVTETSFEAVHDGIRLEESQRALLTNNRFETIVDGIEAKHVVDTRIEANTFSGGIHAVTLADAPDSSVVDNELHHHPHYAIGVVWGTSTNVHIERNDIHHNEVGLRIEDTPTVEVHENDIHDNDLGLLAEELVAPVNATENWWGHASGPSGGIEDGCAGTVADGEGDWIETRGGADVCFEPWLTAPAVTTG